MKKIILFMSLLLILTGCNKKLENNNNIDSNLDKNLEKEENDDKEKYIDDNDTILGLYLYTNSYTPRRLVTTYDGEFISNKDIVSLEVFATNEEEISGGTFQNIFPNYFNESENKHKIGFEISFATNDKNYRQIILRPSDTNTLFDFVQLYLYDDVHKPIGSWYSHVTDEEYNSDTLLTSIKLTGGTKINDITSDIKVIVFSYDEDDFDEEGYYRGISKYEAIIHRKA